MSSHNERIAAKRQQACLDFMRTTSTNLSTAQNYLAQTAFDLERAVSLFYDAGGEPLPSDDEEEEEKAPRQEQQDETQDPSTATNDTADDGDPISSIMNAARKKAPPESSSPSNSFEGKGFSLNSSSASQKNSTDNANDESPSTLKIRVTFYKDGFTDQEEREEGSDKQKEASTRRRGVYSFSSSSSLSTPRLPPKETYEENAQFIQEVQDNRVPMKYQRLDDRNRPIPVSMLLDDQRKRDYPIEIWQKQQEEDQPKLSHFGGAGQALGSSTSDPSSDRTSNNENSSESNHNPVAWILALLLSWWHLLHSLVTRWMRQVAAVPLIKHTVDPNKPTTRISLRMPNNSKFKRGERVKFNTDHTVEDLRRYCRMELGEIRTDDDFELLAGFPPKTVHPEQNNKTLSEAGLLNSAVDIRVFSTNKDKRRN